MRVQIDPKPEFLHVTVTGEFALKEAQASFCDILAAAEEHKLAKVLFDGRGISGDPTTIQRFCYAEYVAHETTRFGRRSTVGMPRFAYVLEAPVLDAQRFGETVALNRGMDVKTFDDVGEARRWLRLDQEEVQQR